MKNIEEIWNTKEMDAFFTESTSELPVHTMNSEFDKFNSVLKIEIVIGVIATIVFLILKPEMSKGAFTLFMIIAICGLSFSIYGYRISKKIKLEDYSLLFLSNTVKILKHFVIKYYVLIQVVLVFTFFYIGIIRTETTFLEFLTSNFGIKTGLIILSVDVICVLYGHFFYARKYFRLLKVLKEFENE